MKILDYNHGTEALHCTDEMWFGGGDFGGSRASSAKAKTDGKVTTIKSGFNDHAVTLPNGCKVIIYETGEVFLQEEGGAQKKIRHANKLQQSLIK